MFITIDDYYNVQFYNEAKEALKNNSVQFKEYISSKPPYRFYFEVEIEPQFINYDMLPDTQSRFLVNIVKALTPQQEYLFERRDFNGQKALDYYTINDALITGQKTREGIFFHAYKADVIRISKQYPRKIWFMGRYVDRRYMVFFADNLVIKNLISPENILVESKKFKHITELEIELNYNVFLERDRLEKLSHTPYVQKNIYKPIQVLRPDLSDKFVLN